MKRRKLQLVPLKENNTLHSYFTKKQPNTDVKKDSESHLLKETPTGDPSCSGTPDIEKSVKRAGCGADDDCETNTPSQPSTKKAKLCDSDNGSEDVIPATPEESTPQPKRHTKSKSRRSISFAPSSVLLQSKNAKDLVDVPTAVKSENPLSPLDKKKQISTKHKAPNVSKCISGKAIQSTMESCDNASNNDDIVLAEILGEVVPSEEKNPASAVSRLQNGSMSTSEKYHALKTSNIAEDDSGLLAEILADIKPAEKIPVTKSNERSSNVLSTTSKLYMNDNSKIVEGKTMTEKDSNPAVLKDTTATKSSPNKGDSHCDDLPKKNEKRRNIFLDPIEKEDKHLLQKLGFKRADLLDQKDSKSREIQVQKDKSQITSLQTVPSRPSPKTPSSDDKKSAAESPVMYPSLNILKEKLLRKNPRLSLPSGLAAKCTAIPATLNDDSSNKTSLKSENVGNVQNGEQERAGLPPVLPVEVSAISSSNPALCRIDSENLTENEVAKDTAVEVMDGASLAVSESRSPKIGTVPGEKDCGLGNPSKNLLSKSEAATVKSSVCSEKICDDIGTKIENGHHNPAVKMEMQNVPSTDFILEDCFDANEIDGFQDDWGLSQFTAEKNDSESPQSYPETLELGTARHCKVISVAIVKRNWEFTLWAQCDETKKTASCTVRGSWATLTVERDDTVCLEAVLANNENCSTRWIIDNTRGMMVLHPNYLISGTSIVGSLFCARKAVLSDSFKGVDAGSPVMAIGSLIHEIMQEVLQENLRNLADIQQKAEVMICDPKNVRRFYEAGLSLSQVRSELEVYLPTIAAFVSKYVFVKQTNKNGKRLCVPQKAPHEKPEGFLKNSEEWKGRIVGIEDIEENLWDPMLGVKGKVDVTVKIEGSKGDTKLLPLEIKTGRTSHSAEHRGQVMLYSMMLSRLGLPVESGLLLYLREGSIREVKLSHQEKRDLVIMRNRLAHHLVLQSKVDDCDIEDIPTLPEPINFAKVCAKCPYLNVCSAYLTRDTKTRLEEDHPMNQLSLESTRHLTNDHLNYFFEGVRMLQLESKEDSDRNRISNVWSMLPEKREKLGQSLVNLKIEGDVQQNAGKFVHTFVRNRNVELACSQPLSDDFRKSNLSVDEYIVISTNIRVAVDTGSVLDIDSDSISVACNRDLRKRNANGVFHIDTYGSNTMMLKFDMSNLASLLDDTESAKRVREAVIDKIPPSFSRPVKKDLIKDLVHLLAKLNRSQRDAVLAVLKADHYALIKGLPGTGKTATMVALVCLLVKLGQTVLITSQTHSAVDNLLLRLKKKGVNFLRVGSAKKIHPELLKHSEGYVTRDCKTPEDLARTLDSFQVVGVVCLGTTHPLFSRGRTFDICLVDESTQVLQSTVLRPLLCAERFVLVGDPDQLPPVVRSKRASALGLGVSLFARLDQGEATKSLCLNYRMNQCITDVANKLTYDNKLKCGSEDVANAVLQLPNLKAVLEDSRTTTWLKTVLEPSLQSSVFFLDSCGARLDQRSETMNTLPESGDKLETTVTNFYEIVVLKKILECLVKAGVDQNEVGVIAPYRAQVAFIRKVFKTSGEYAKVEINSVDQYQGRDKQVIIYSCTRSDTSAGNRKPKEHEILNDHRRLTVAVTRAKRKLILIGDFATLQNYKPFAKLFSCLSSEQKINLPPEP